MKRFSKFIQESIKQADLSESIDQIKKHHVSNISHFDKYPNGDTALSVHHQRMARLHSNASSEAKKAGNKKMADAHSSAANAHRSANGTVSGFNRAVEKTKQTFNESVELDEKLKASDDMGDWVKDFQDSDAPQFKGKSQKKRQQMAIAAKLDAEREAGMRKEEVELDEVSDNTLAGLIRLKMQQDAEKKYRDSKLKNNKMKDPMNSLTSKLDQETLAGLSRLKMKQDADKKYKASKIKKEEVEIDEAVEVSHDRYMRSHGKKASGGEGSWMFTHKRMGDANVNDPKEVHSAPRSKFSDAKKSAQQWAKKHGHSTVYVMEEVEIDEATKKLTGGQRSAKVGAAMDPSEKRIPKRGTKAYAAWMAKNDERRKAELAKWKNEEVQLDEDLNAIAKDHDVAAKKHSTAYKETKSYAAARNHEVAYNRHADAAKAHREAANDKSKHSSEKLEKMSNHAWDATDHTRKHFDESVDLDEAKTDIYHKHMLKALGKSRLPKGHQYTSAIATNGDFVVKDGGGRTVGRIPKGDHNLNEVSDKKLDAYRQKAFADQPAGDDGSDKYRKRKFGRDLAFAKQTGRAKVLATKEEVDLDEVYQETANYLVSEGIELESLNEEQLNELIGAVARGIGRGLKSTVVNKKGNFRFSTAGRADAAQKRADAVKKRSDNIERLRKQRERLAKERERLSNLRRARNNNT